MSTTAWGCASCSCFEMPESDSSCCHSFGSPVNSPVSTLKPTWVRWTGSYGVEISIFFWFDSRSVCDAVAEAAGK